MVASCLSWGAKAVMSLLQWLGAEAVTLDDAKGCDASVVQCHNVGHTTVEVLHGSARPSQTSSHDHKHARLDQPQACQQ